VQGVREGIAFAWGHGAIRTGLVLIAMINLAVLDLVVIGVVELMTLRFGGGALVGLLATAWLQRQSPALLQVRVMALAMLAGVAFDPLPQVLSGVLIDISLPGLFLTTGGSLLRTVPFALRRARG
jgi:hypothetical protein